MPTEFPPTEQLVVELYVADIHSSAAFYQRFGFKTVRAEADFIVLGWDSSQLFLEQIPNCPPPPERPVGNLRVMVANADDYWALAQALGALVINPIADREYGLRDFTIAGPDGLGLRFASVIALPH